ncbi:MAG: hypothetical protein IKE52_00350 [Mogibacterium sp.]|nr:hypothetical protein [Mogibacterium sp.]
MVSIRHELAGYKLPAYIEEILTQNYCPGFMRMSMIRENENYQFSYRPGAYRKLEYMKLSLYEKMILIKTLISLSEISKDHLIKPESYLLEPELIYLKDENVAIADVKIMYYPDVKKLSFRYKLVLFADRILEKGIKEEKDALEQLRQASESGDVNRIKLMLDKQIMRLENRMSEGGNFS